MRSTLPLAGTKAGTAKPRRRMTLDAWLWILATVVMLVAAVYQHETGPTYPLKGSFEVDGQALHYKLPRTHGGLGDQVVSIPYTGGMGMGYLSYRRLGMQEPFTEVLMNRESGKLYAILPHQPPAGKLEYFIGFSTYTDKVRIPPQGTVAIRFRGDVPAGILIPHIIFMFFGMLFAVRTGLELLHPGARLRRLSWYTLALLTIGGLVFGPIVQKYAFGAYWTGVPFGWDLTDNKLLINVLVWAAAVFYLGWPRTPVKALGRWLVLAACLVTLAVYLIPHSLHGSTLDYKKVEQGVDPADAVGQG